MNKSIDWTIDSDEAEVGATVTAENVAADQADSLLIGEIQASVLLISYMVAVGRNREAAGTLTDEGRKQLRQIERSGQDMLEALTDLIEAKPLELLIDGGDQ